MAPLLVALVIPPHPNPLPKWGRGRRIATLLAPVGRDGLDGVGKFLVRAEVHGAMADVRARGERAEKIAVSPIVSGPDGPRTKTAAAIRADVLEDSLHTRATESAFERANHRVNGMRRQGPGAVFTNRSEFQHRGINKCAGGPVRELRTGRRRHAAGVRISLCRQ